MALGVYKGSGTYGVTTRVINPVTNDPTVALFETEAEALTYARLRALRSGSPVRVPGQPPDRSKHGRIYYIERFLPHEFDNFGRRASTPLYRVLRGMRGEVQEYTRGIPERDQETVLVARFVQVRQTKKGLKEYWDVVPGLSMRVTDLEAEYEAARRAKGTQRVSRVDMGRNPRGHKQKRLRQGRGPKYGPVPEDARSPAPRPGTVRGTSHEELLRDYQREALRASRESMRKKLRETIAALEALKERIEQEFLKTRNPLLPARAERVEEAITVEQAKLDRLGG